MGGVNRTYSGREVRGLVFFYAKVPNIKFPLKGSNIRPYARTFRNIVWNADNHSFYIKFLASKPVLLTRALCPFREQIPHFCSRGPLFARFGNKNLTICSRRLLFAKFGNKNLTICSRRLLFAKFGNKNLSICSRGPLFAKFGNKNRTFCSRRPAVMRRCRSLMGIWCVRIRRRALASGRRRGRKLPCMWPY